MLRAESLDRWGQWGSLGVSWGRARVAGETSDPEQAEEHEADAEAGRLDQNTLRKFGRDLTRDDVDATVKALAHAIKALPNGNNKAEKFRKLVLAFQTGGAAECKRKFANTEILQKCTNLQSAQTAVPYTLALGRWFGGDRALFAEALANGDIAELETEAGQRLYSYTEHTRTEKTSKQKKVQGDGLDSLQLDFGWQRTGNKGSSSRGPLALTDVEAKAEVAETKAESKAEGNAVRRAVAKEDSEEESHNAKPPAGLAPTAEA
jgi:hypothetical protein